MEFAMSKNSMNLREIYRALREEPSPAQKFVTQIAALCCREEKTVRQWLSGSQVPPPLVQGKIAEMLDSSVEVLFPVLDKPTKKRK